MSYDILTASVLTFVAIGGLIAVVVLVLRQAKEQTKLIEQAFIHLGSRNSTEATNAMSALEFNRDLLKMSPAKQEPTPPPNDPAVIKDKLTGRVYDVIGGDV